MEVHWAQNSSTLNGTSYDGHGIWHYVALTKDVDTSSSAFTFYYDGIQVSPVVNTSSLLAGNCYSGANNSIWLGQDPYNTSTDLSLDGDMAEVRISDFQKSAMDISNTWNEQATSTSNLLGLWEFAGTSTDLVTGNSTSGQIGNPGYASSSPFGHFLLNYVPPAITSTEQINIYNYDGASIPSALVSAIDIWNAQGSTVGGGVDITTTTDLDDATIIATTTDVTSSAYYAEFDPQTTPSELKFNIFYTASGTYDNNLFASLHELGHSLGLDHSYLGNIMNWYVTGQTYLGSQDKSDYDFLWGN